MRTKICAELATGHGGKVDVALQMIDAAADAGCDAVKVQHYGAVNPNDPQAAWIEQSRLTPSSLSTLSSRAKARGIEFWASPFSARALAELTSFVAIDVTRIKIASSEAHAPWWGYVLRAWAPVISWPWGQQPSTNVPHGIHLTAIPLYPTPLEAVYRAPLLDGWSDHTVGLDACLYMISQGAQWIEAHLTLGEGKSRVMPFDKMPDDFTRLREFAESVETMRSGIGATFRNRWTA
jgi:sialic acid synthase SpsE